VWYRTEGETEWHTGLTRSISATGALIRADEAGAPAEDVVVAIELPSVASCLVGHGRIVRVVGAPGEDAPATFAVQVKNYRLDRRDAILQSSVH
jgi:hypothetical protein